MDKVRQLRVLLVGLFIILLTSCSTTPTKRDGAPKFYVDETRIPNATPKPEKLAKYGNMPSYVVFGKRYYTMKSSRNYDAIGTASWYGTQFHARNTSSGEPYDMLAMTAAHKTLPLPTYVEVTNLENSKKIIVKVNDRGPFAPNRIIDLSYVAAKKLGMTGRGTAKVRVKAINPYAPIPQPSLNDLFAFKKPSDNTFYLQVGAFREKNHALSLQRQLAQLFSTPVSISKSKYYKVKIGPIHDTATANRISSRLKRLGLSSNKTGM